MKNKSGLFQAGTTTFLYDGSEGYVKCTIDEVNDAVNDAVVTVTTEHGDVISYHRDQRLIVGGQGIYPELTAHSTGSKLYPPTAKVFKMVRAAAINEINELIADIQTHYASRERNEKGTIAEVKRIQGIMNHIMNRVTHLEEWSKVS